MIRKFVSVFQQKHRNYSVNLSGSEGNRNNERRRGRVGLRARKDFYEQLSFFLSSCLPLGEALELISESRDLRFVKEMKHPIQNGMRLAQVLEQYRLSDSFCDACMRIGEQSGSHAELLPHVVQYLEQRIQERNFLVQIVMYPALLMVLLLLLLTFVIFFLTPMLVQTFEGMQIAIPWSLRQFYRFYKFADRNEYFIYIVLFSGIPILISGIVNQKLSNAVGTLLMKSRRLHRYLQPFALRSILW